MSQLAPVGSFVLVPNIFHLTFVQNTGVAFGLFREHPEWLVWLIAISLVALIILSSRMAFETKLTEAAFVLILGGAAGNWTDRMRYGYVIDFLDFRIWPVFNFADTCITVGVGLYLIHLFLGGASQKK